MDNNSIDDRHIRVFISSTFQDMEKEREQLIKKVFPLLRGIAGARGVVITELDLRWGITQEESENGKVLEICLNERRQILVAFLIAGEHHPHFLR